MVSRAKTVSQLAGLIGGRVSGRGDPSIVDLTHDSREVRKGWLYVAFRGAAFDGHSFVPAAVHAGAPAVCVEHETGSGVPELVVSDTREVVGDLAAAVHDYPSRSLRVIGVTGTNGKTTVTHFIESIARHAGVVTGLMGTIHTRFADTTVAASMTTPEAPEYQRLLAEMRDRKVSLVATEVSSHALDYRRVRGTRFAVAAFTNLSQDHLDFHGDMDSYRAAKTRLFTDYEVGTAVFNIDDPVGADLAARNEGPAHTVGAGGDVSVGHVSTPVAGHTRFHLETPWGGANVRVPLVGEFNLSNLAVAATCCVAAGVDFAAVVEALPHLGGVPGRFEVVSADDPITVIVDYAHTPEAVVRSVETARGLTTGRVIALLGAGGDRDRRKRPAMGAALSSADFAIITSDNPRHEDPEDIAAAVVSGVDPTSDHAVEIDRLRAIDRAIALADDGDVVLVLGRGHEPMQDLGRIKIPFDDREIAAASLARRRSSAAYDESSGSMSP